MEPTKRTYTRKADVPVDMSEPMRALVSPSTGEHQHKARIAYALAQPLCNTTLAALADINDPINSQASGKKLGAVVTTEDALVYISLGELPESPWVNRLSESTITPEGIIPSTSGVTGDRRRVAKPIVASCNSFPVVAPAALADATHPINQNHLSGKQLGAVVCDTDGYLYVATGSESNSAWGGVKRVTPTGTVSPSIRPTTGEYYKAVEAIACDLSIPVVPLIQITAPDLSLNDPNLSGKKLGSVVIADNGKMFVSTGKYASSTFRPQF